MPRNFSDIQPKNSPLSVCFNEAAADAAEFFCFGESTLGDSPRLLQ